jgi:hypothetical protein
MSHTATQTTTGGPRRDSPSVPTTSYRTASVDGLKVLYREAGDPKAPVVLLLHGFPTSSPRTCIGSLSPHSPIAIMW